MVWLIITIFNISILVLLSISGSRQATYYHRAFLHAVQLFPPEVGLILLEKYPNPGILRSLFGVRKIKPVEEIEIKVRFESLYPHPPDKPSGPIYH